MTLKELIEYLQQEVLDGTSEGTELERFQLRLPDTCIMSVGLRTMIHKKGSTPIRVINGESISAALKAHKESKEVKDK